MNFQVFPYDVAVKNLLVVRESDQLIVLSEQEVVAIPLHRCHAANKSCGDCVALQDPYCAWDIKTNACQPYRPGQKEQLQNVNIGYHPQCPVPIEPTTTVSSKKFLSSNGPWCVSSMDGLGFFQRGGVKKTP